MKPQQTTYRYLFGPVPSRRLGRSLGVDLTPFKTCSLDCIFCQLGHTLEKTVERKEYVPVDAVIAEIDTWLETDGSADHITLSGSGEPTLHSGFGHVLAHLRKNHIPSVLLTNGTFFSLPEVREAAAQADIVKISLSAWDQISFEIVNRPHKKMRFSDILNGYKAFREQYHGRLWIEVFMLMGINAMPDTVKKIAGQIKSIRPDEIHMNTAVRPPAENFAAALPEDRMKTMTHLFDPTASVITDYRKVPIEKNRFDEDAIMALLRRRPCTMEQITNTFGMHINEVSKYLGKLMHNHNIHPVRNNGRIYYSLFMREDDLIHVKKIP